MVAFGSGGKFEVELAGLRTAVKALLSAQEHYQADPVDLHRANAAYGATENVCRLAREMEALPFNKVLREDPLFLAAMNLAETKKRWHDSTASMEAAIAVQGAVAKLRALVDPMEVSRTAANFAASLLTGKDPVEAEANEVVDAYSGPTLNDLRRYGMLPLSQAKPCPDGPELSDIEKAVAQVLTVIEDVRQRAAKRMTDQLRPQVERQPTTWVVGNPVAERWVRSDQREVTWSNPGPARTTFVIARCTAWDAHRFASREEAEAYVRGADGYRTAGDEFKVYEVHLGLRET